MFYAMGFQIEYGKTYTFAIRKKPYPNFEDAKKAIERAKLQGFVKKYGSPIPIWSNVL